MQIPSTDAARRVAVLAEVLRCLATFEGRDTDSGMIVSFVMGALGASEEEIGHDVHMALFLLSARKAIIMNTPGSIGPGTTARTSKFLSTWLKEGTKEYDDGEGPA